MNFQKLTPLPLGCITASGWLHEQLSRNKDGMGGHLDELEPRMIATPYTEHTTEPNWGGPGWGAEISGNYWYGLISLAFTLDDEDLKRKAENWVNAVLLAREEDGYMGAYAKTDNRDEDYNAWGTACGMRAMIAYYEATGREDVFDAVYQCMLWFCRNWANHKTVYAGHTITEPMLYCYQKTGDQRLLDFVMDYDAFLEEESHNPDNLLRNSTSFLAGSQFIYNSNHTVAYGFSLKRPALIYGATGEERYLDASVNGLDKLRAKSMQITGAPVSVCEWLSPVSMSAESEYCNFAVYNQDYAVLAQMTGDSLYGDYMEQICYNAAEGARKKDEKAIAYMSAPNQFGAADNATHNHIWGTMYAPCQPTSCCPVYSVHVFPDLIRNMVMEDPDGGLHFQVYGPCRIRYAGLDITVNTLYPFRDTLQILFHAEKPVHKKLFFKIPGWCTDYSVLVNGASAGNICERDWCDGDVIDLRFGRTPEIVPLDDRDAGNKQPLGVRYGPLVFVFPIPEIWEDAGNGYARTPLPEGWRWYNVRLTSWFSKQFCYALDEKNALLSICAAEKPENGYVWENPPLELTIDAYYAPYTYTNGITETHEYYGTLQYVTEKSRITLVPYGCTALRVTYFPRADL